MKKRRIALLSKNKTLTRFFELEAKMQDIELCVFDRIPEDIFVFSTVVVDIDTIRQGVNADPRSMIYISGEISSSELFDGVNVLTWPLSIVEMRKIFFEEKDIEQECVYSGSKTITFCKGIDNVIKYSGKVIPLTEIEATVLKALCENKGEAVSRERLNLLLGAQDGNIVDVYICKLRKKLEDPEVSRVIYTVRGSGYKIVVGMEQE